MSSRSKTCPRQRLSFYEHVVASWIPDRDASILVVGGGKNDRDVLAGLSFRKVVISNLDERMVGNEDEFAPFQWAYQNAENLSYKAGEFDYVVVHAALHHCASPHRALLEMYRVARRAAIVIESRDSRLMSLLVKFRFTDVYEPTAVYYNDCKFGGVNNTDIPNFVYRWTEHEIEKTIASYAPHAKHRIHYRYASDIPHLTSVQKKRGLRGMVLAVAAPAYKLFAWLFPKQQNLFAWKIEKPTLPEDLMDWISLASDGSMKFNKAWGDQRYVAKPPDW
ncbi:MAG: methyltransferase domain-containing protein [Pirellulales bacterium]|nr:methyltransferase domain-containing protein [Pirellulales bacterium]